VSKRKTNVSQLDRLSWDEVFMTMVCVYAQRSLDLVTRHGRVIVKYFAMAHQTRQEK